MGKLFNIFLMCFIINIFLSTQEEPTKFFVSINTKEIELGGGFYIKDQTGIEEPICQYWLPSLFIPIIFVDKDTKTSDGEKLVDKTFELKIPFFNDYYEFTVQPYDNIPFLNKNYKGTLMKPAIAIKNCYFGISPESKNYGTLEKEKFILNDLKSKTLINKKIFSFDEWDIKTDPKNPKTYFNLGESQEVFNSNEGVVGTCQTNPDDSFWGCSFKEMLFNNINIPLANNSTEKFYKIYIASETHNIIFPSSFKRIFIENPNINCKFNDENYLACSDFFNQENYAPLRLTEENEQFIITGEIDNKFRFNEDDEKKKNLARVIFQEGLDYIILPLTVFKKFHVQFNAENNEISFYTTDSNILQVKEKKNSSSGLKVFLILLIILIILALGFGIYWFLKKRRTPETNINKFSKFEDEENYKNLNENKVF